MIRKDARADAHADNQIAAIDRQGFLEGLYDSQSGPPDVLQIGGASDHYRKFIPAQSRCEPQLPGGLFQAFCKIDQHSVAKGVAHPVVEILEVVDVEEKYAHQTSFGACPGD